LAASSRGMTARPARKSSSAEGRAKATASFIPRKRERRQRCQRLGRQQAPWEDNAHALARTHRTR
jgi:hypothetical protein